MIFIVRTITNKEEQAADLVVAKAKKENLKIYSVVKPHSIKGYIFMEAIDREEAEKATYGTPYVRGLLNKQVKYEDIQNLLTPTAETYNIEEGDIVEIISEPFKKEKAKVKRINKQKEEAIVELLEATVPIPVPVKLDNIRVIRREKPETGKIDNKSK